MNKAVEERYGTASTGLHVAIIMDGNGRWAKAKELDRFKGHQAGVESLNKIVEQAPLCGVDCLTLYAFSTENWNRPKEEVDHLMALLAESLQIYVPQLRQQGVRLRLIGQREGLSEPLLEAFDQAESDTQDGRNLTLQLAINYSSHSEINDAVKRIVKDYSSGIITEDRLASEEYLIDDYLFTSPERFPDLLIRTGGERRLSNYLLYQLAYSELYFTDCLWPDFTPDGLKEAIEWFKARDRRFGNVIK